MFSLFRYSGLCETISKKRNALSESQYHAVTLIDAFGILLWGFNRMDPHDTDSHNLKGKVLLFIPRHYTEARTVIDRQTNLSSSVFGNQINLICAYKSNTVPRVMALPLQI